METVPQGAEASEAVSQDEPSGGTARSVEGEGGEEMTSENPAPSTETAKKDTDEEKTGGEEKGKGVEGGTKKAAKEEPKKSAERDVGITEYASDHVGFFGIIKQR